MSDDSRVGRTHEVAHDERLIAIRCTSALYDGMIALPLLPLGNSGFVRESWQLAKRLAGANSDVDQSIDIIQH